MNWPLKFMPLGSLLMVEEDGRFYAELVIKQPARYDHLLFRPQL